MNRTVAPGKRTDEVGRLVDLGVRTTARSKPYIIGKCRKLLAGGAAIHSINLKAELDSFVEHESGLMGTTDGCFDDRVMALALALYAAEKAVIFAGPRDLPKIEVIDPFQLESIIGELEKRRSGFPFKSQVM